MKMDRKEYSDQVSATLSRLTQCISHVHGLIGHLVMYYVKITVMYVSDFNKENKSDHRAFLFFTTVLYCILYCVVPGLGLRYCTVNAHCFSHQMKRRRFKNSTMMSLMIMRYTVIHCWCGFQDVSIKTIVGRRETWHGLKLNIIADYTGIHEKSDSRNLIDLSFSFHSIN